MAGYKFDFDPDRMRAVYLKSVKSPLAHRGFVLRQPAKTMNHSEIFSQAVVEQDSEYAHDSFCVDSDEVEEEEEATHHEPSFTPLPPRAAKMRAQRLQANKAKIDLPINRRRKRIIFQDNSSDEEENGPPPSKKSDTGQSANKFAQSRLSTKPQERSGTFLRPANTISTSSASDQAVFLPPTSKTATINNIKPAVVAAASGSIFAKINNNSAIKSDNGVSSVFTTTSAIAKSSSSATVGSNATGSNAMKSSSSLTSNSSAGSSSSNSCNSAPSSPPRTLLVSSRQVATSTQVISSLQVKYRCATHVCSFDVADFVLSSQLGVIRKLHSGKFDVDTRLTTNPELASKFSSVLSQHVQHASILTKLIFLKNSPTDPAAVDFKSKFADFPFYTISRTWLWKRIGRRRGIHGSPA